MEQRKKLRDEYLSLGGSPNQVRPASLRFAIHSAHAEVYLFRLARHALAVDMLAETTFVSLAVRIFPDIIRSELRKWGSCWKGLLFEDVLIHCWHTQTLDALVFFCKCGTRVCF